jgi:hypothetical protein
VDLAKLLDKGGTPVLGGVLVDILEKEKRASCQLKTHDSRVEMRSRGEKRTLLSLLKLASRSAGSMVIAWWIALAVEWTSPERQVWPIDESQYIEEE